MSNEYVNTVTGVVDLAATKTDEFSVLLEKIEYAKPETKKLWREIYENALDDRSHAYLLFADLYTIVSNSGDGHAVHGKTIATYLEKMNKANDQLLRLAELIDEAAGENEEIDAEALYEEFNSKK